jgi:hypothetical protein
MALTAAQRTSSAGGARFLRQLSSTCLSEEKALSYVDLDEAA